MPFIGQELTEYIKDKEGTENGINSELLAVIQIIASVGVTIARKIRNLNFCFLNLMRGPCFHMKKLTYKSKNWN